MKKNRRRRCRCCQQLFYRDPRTRARQKYCSEARCRAASKQASQHRWLQKPENQDYFCGAQHVSRVQAWRHAQREYGREAALAGSALQEMRMPQPVEQRRKSAALALQEMRRSQVFDTDDRDGVLRVGALQEAM